ncbi:UNVERIFIED_CONTAM: hypothetical protein HDU68_007949 [Siphonaria sp. JEL0065]|nr:hypothetical protein HDU68_007949 [Siphonaria sp. JEL0065]
MVAAPGYYPQIGGAFGMVPGGKPTGGFQQSSRQQGPLPQEERKDFQSPPISPWMDKMSLGVGNVYLRGEKGDEKALESKEEAIKEEEQMVLDPIGLLIQAAEGRGARV